MIDERFSDIEYNIKVIKERIAQAAVKSGRNENDVKLMAEASLEATGNELLVCGSCLSDLSVISKYGSSLAFGFGAGITF